jgi:hypothetical protein
MRQDLQVERSSMLCLLTNIEYLMQSLKIKQKVLVINSSSPLTKLKISLQVFVPTTRLMATMLLLVFPTVIQQRVSSWIAIMMAGTSM